MIHTLTEKLNFFQGVFGSGRLARNSINFDVRCPICAPKDPSKKKLSIRTDDDRCHCWVCGFKAHTVAPLIRKYGTLEDLITYRDKFMPASEVNRRCMIITLDDKPKKLALPDDFKLLTLLTRADPDVKSAWRYLAERNVSERDAWYFKIGISDEGRWSRRIIIPSFDADGELNYFVARAIDRTRKPKYDNPDVLKTPIIFNEINIDWSQRLVLCEGAFDMFKCIDNTVPLLGSDFNEESALFNKIVANSTPVALALDGDMWHKKTPRIAKKLSEYDVDVIVVDTRAWEDPGKMTKQEFKIALSQARKMEWNDTFMDRLSRASRTSLRL